MDPLPSPASRGIQVWQEVSPNQRPVDMVGRPMHHVSLEVQASGEAVYLDDMPPQEGKAYCDDVTTWTCFPHYRPFVWWIHQPSVDSPHKGPVMWRDRVLESCGISHELCTNGKLRDVTMPALSYVIQPQVVMTTAIATSEEKVGIMMTLGFYEHVFVLRCLLCLYNQGLLE